jgi:hypothetical protein
MFQLPGDAQVVQSTGLPTPAETEAVLQNPSTASLGLRGTLVTEGVV